MKWLGLLAFLFALAAVAAPKKGKKKPPPPPPVLTAPSEKLADAMGLKAAEVVTTATRFELARTSYAQGIRPAPELQVGSDFQREGPWQELDPAAVAKFKAIVYDEKAFRLGSLPNCNFVPDVVFQLTSAGLDNQQLLVSFACNRLLFFTVKPGGRAVPGMALDFKPGRKRMLELIQPLFRKDAALRELK